MSYLEQNPYVEIPEQVSQVAKILLSQCDTETKKIVYDAIAHDAQRELFNLESAELEAQYEADHPGTVVRSNNPELPSRTSTPALSLEIIEND